MSKSTRKAVRDDVTPRDEAYCQARASGSTPREAYMAVFKPKSTNPHTLASGASRIENKPAVVRRIAALEGRISDKVVESVATKIIVTREWVLEQLWDNAMKAKAAVPVLDKQGEPIGVYEANYAASNRALELLGKNLGMFKDAPPEIDPIHDLTDEQLAAAVELIKRVIAEKEGGGGPDGASGPDGSGTPGTRH